jgi:hypothetical protein
MIWFIWLKLLKLLCPDAIAVFNAAFVEIIEGSPNDSLKLKQDIQIGKTTFKEGASVKAIIDKATKSQNDLDEVLDKYPEALQYLLNK